MKDCTSQIEVTDSVKCKKLQPKKTANNAETLCHQILAGTLIYIGQAVLPQECSIASMMQQKLESLRISDIIEAILMLRDMKKL